ncbi:hypothetical protein AVEN_61459-1 [Araneus ventricosus]|uniref:Uncharacterized protein n=1 Tax=Araneus ventricosus TaxID=182803 RepID=A0A4Y2UCA3_ARAVE|nr:hypothetical protein AVEN_61459-1 [Araneus ventricosus]
MAETLGDPGGLSQLILAIEVLKGSCGCWEHQIFRKQQRMISRDMYMDDIQISNLSTSAKGCKLIIKLLRRGGFELHKWVSNHPACYFYFQNIHLKIRSRTQ